MARSPLYIFRKHIVLSALVVVFLMGFVYALHQWLGSRHNSSGGSGSSNNLGTWTQAAPSGSLPQYSSGGSGGYSLTYPNTWTRTSPDASNYTILTSTQNGTTYTFRISPPAQIDPEGEPNLSYDTANVVYAGRAYVRTVWKSNGMAFHITAVPQDPTAGADGLPVYVMVMDFPSLASGDYTYIFDQVAKGVKY